LDSAQRASETLVRLGSLETVDLAETKLTDAGLRKLGEAPALRRIFAGGTRVTAAGVEAFREAHPGIELTWWPPIDDDAEYENVAP